MLLLQNLRITGTIPAEGSNFSGADFDVSEHSLDSNDASYAGYCDLSYGYSNPCSKASSSTELGVYYNYSAATAGTVLGSNTTDAVQDICPVGWRLPTGPNTVAGTDLNRLLNNTISGEQDIASDLTSFNLVAGGHYYGGELVVADSARWWSATIADSSLDNAYYRRTALAYVNNFVRGDQYPLRTHGFYIRCVLQPTMQDATSSSLSTLMPNDGNTAIM